MGCNGSKETPSVYPAEDSIKKKDRNRNANKSVKKLDKAESKTRESASFDSSDDESFAKFSKTKPVAVFVIGGPTSDLRTQSEMLKVHYGFTHLCVENILDEEKASGSAIGKIIEDYASEGKSVPAVVTARLIKKAMKKAGWQKSFYLIEGFPKDQESLDAWRNVLKEKVDVKMVLLYDCSTKVMEKRLLERGLTTETADDNLEVIRQTIATYQEEIQPVVKQLEKEKLLKKVNAEKGPNQVFTEAQNALKSVKKFLKVPEPKPKVVFVLGSEESGKKAQCERIVDEFDFKHLFVGELLRNETNTDSPLCKEIEEYICQGQIVPTEIPVKLLKQAIEKAPKGTKGFLIDDFPRNKESMMEWNRIMGDSVEIIQVLYYECSIETVEKRVLDDNNRRVSEGALMALRRSLSLYQKEIAPVVEECSKQGFLTKIVAEQEEDEIYSMTKKALQAALDD